MQKTLNSKSTFLFGLLIIAIGTIGAFISDMYLPSMPTMVHALSTSGQGIKYSLSIYLLGFSLTQLFWGPLSDKIGRRHVVISGLCISLIGSLLFVYSTSLFMLLTGRLLQGIGMGACMGVTRAAASDIFSGQKLASFISYVSVFVSLAPAIAPTLGGYLQHFFGWRANFIFMLSYSLLLLLIVLCFLPETNKNRQQSSFKLPFILENYKTLFRSRKFIAYTLSSSLAFANMMVYATLSSFLFQDVFHMTAIAYSHLAIYLMLGVMLGKIFSAKLLNKITMKSSVLIGYVLMLLGGFLLLSTGMFHVANLIIIYTPIVIFAMGAGFIFPNAVAGAFMDFRYMGGTASALYGSLQILGGFIASCLVAVFVQTNQDLLATSFIILSLLGVLSFYILLRAPALSAVLPNTQ